jgi:cell division protein FtsW (lipid II flippase)
VSETTALRQLMGRWLTLRPFRLPRIRIGGAGGALTGLVLLALCLAVLGFWWHNATHLIESARPVVSLERLDLALARGETATIGRRELLQPQRFDAAEARHVALTRQPDGRVTIRNVANTRRLWLDYANGSGSFSARWRFQPGDRIAAGALAIAVDEARPGRLALTLTEAGRPGARKLTIDSTGPLSTLRLDGNALPVCQPLSSADRIRGVVTGLIATDERGEDKLVSLGGRLTCSVREEVHIAANALPFKALTIVARGGGYFLAPGDAVDAPRPPVVFARGNQRITDFTDIAWELDPEGPARLSHMIIGRTRYAVEVGQEANGRLPLRLTPLSKTHRFAPDDAEILRAAATTESVRPVVTPPRQPMSAAELGNPLSSLNGVERIVRLLLTLGVAVFGVLSAMHHATLFRRSAILVRLVGALGSTAFIGATTMLVLAPELSRLGGASISYEAALHATILAYAIACIAIMIGPRFTTPLRLTWLGLVMLCCLGSLTLTALGIDAEKTDFTIHAEKNKLLFFDLIPVVAVVIAFQPQRSIAALPRSFFMGVGFKDQLLRAVPAILILAAFVAWGVLGTETGVAGFQPVELGKIALVLVLAHIFLGFSRIDYFYNQRHYISWLTVSLATVLVFILFLTAVPFLKSDYSPALIIIITTVVLAFAFLLPSTLKRLFEIMRVFLRRSDAPQRKVRRLGWPRGGVLALVLVILLGINAALIYVFPGLVTYAISGQWNLPKERLAAIDVLEKARGGPLRVPAERLLTWYDLDHATKRAATAAQERSPDVIHRDLGFQLLQSKVALAEMPCTLARLDLGLDKTPVEVRRVLDELPPSPVSLCAMLPGARVTPIAERKGEEQDETVSRFTVSDLVRLPVVQNDFIATFLMVRFGLPTGLALLAAQVITVFGLLALAASLLRERAMGSAQEGANKGMAIILVGIATIFALHWSISWGNALGLLPVMGQPMTFIAAATSHHMLMALPSIAIALIAGRLAAIRQLSPTSDPPPWGLWRGLTRGGL